MGPVAGVAQRKTSTIQPVEDRSRVPVRIILHFLRWYRSGSKSYLHKRCSVLVSGSLYADNTKWRAVGSALHFKTILNLPLKQKMVVLHRCRTTISAKPAYWNSLPFQRAGKNLFLLFKYLAKVNPEVHLEVSVRVISDGGCSRSKDPADDKIFLTFYSHSYRGAF